MFSIQNGNSNSVNDDDDGRAADRYFQDNHTRRGKKGGGGVLSRTSNATLANIARISHKDYQSLLAAAPQKHTAELAQLRQMHEFYFPQWLFELTSGFNLLYHGFGSKRRLLTKFAVHYLANARGWPVVVVNGYAPGASLKDVLLRIVNVRIPSSGSPVQLLRFVMSFLDRSDCPFDRLCILLHNIDGPSLRASRTQQGFATLCSHPRVSLIASVDHLHAGLMWDTALAAKFRFVWHDVTTFESYDAEVACEQAPLLLVGSGDKSGDGYLSVRGVEFVLASLTANAKRIFRILAEAQIEQQQQQQQHSSAAASNAAKTTQAKTNAKTTSAAETEGDEFSSSGMSYSVLFNSSRDAFLVGNEVSFRAQLTEFRTHGIIRSHTDQFGTEMLHIPLASDSLAEILTGMEE
ncbi:origin recognition complex subunit 2 [Ramicandelaber brevisporus]|nr:origin recognition complex subunit 2 [Ramicandelaber brevisporus]